MSYLASLRPRGREVQLDLGFYGFFKTADKTFRVEPILEIPSVEG